MSLDARPCSLLTTRVVAYGKLLGLVALGPCVTVAREPSQGRKAAALSGNDRLPQVAWAPQGPAAHLWRLKASRTLMN